MIDNVHLEVVNVELFWDFEIGRDSSFVKINDNFGVN